MGKKDKVKMSLTDFMNDESTGLSSWADEMNALPTAPAERDPSDPKAGMRRPDYARQGRDRDDRNDRYGGGDRFSDRPVRAEVPLPTAPPFTAFVGNLSFEVTEMDLEQLFAGAQVISIRLVHDPEGKPKGFGYVEFGSLKDLEDSLTKTGTPFLNDRPVRVGVAEPQKDRHDESSRSSAAKWERTGPLPSAPSSQRGPPRDRFTSSHPEEDRGERMGFGSKFTPNPPSSGGGSGGFGGGFRRATSERGPSRASSVASFAGGPPEADRGERMGFGSKFVAQPPLSPALSESGSESGFRFGQRSRSGLGAPPSHPAPADDKIANWRSGTGPTPGRMSRQGSNYGQERSPAASVAPSPRLERRKLELNPRSNAAPVAGEPSPDSHKPSPFGAAKPVDSATRERQIEEKMEKDKQEKEERRLKEKAEREEKERSEREERAKVSNPFGAAKPIDARQREQEVEEKLQKEHEARLAKLKEEKEQHLAGKRATQTSPHSDAANGSAAPSTQKSPKILQRAAAPNPEAAPPSSPSEPAKVPPYRPAALRKEGFSYAAAMSQKSSAPASPGTPAVANGVSDNERQKPAKVDA